MRRSVYDRRIKRIAMRNRRVALLCQLAIVALAAAMFYIKEFL